MAGLLFLRVLSDKVAIILPDVRPGSKAYVILAAMVNNSSLRSPFCSLFETPGYEANTVGAWSQYVTYNSIHVHVAVRRFTESHKAKLGLCFMQSCLMNCVCVHKAYVAVYKHRGVRNSLAQGKDLLTVSTLTKSAWFGLPPQIMTKSAALLHHFRTPTI